jgi:hypothetical protein
MANSPARAAGPAAPASFLPPPAAPTPAAEPLTAEETAALLRTSRKTGPRSKPRSRSSGQAARSRPRLAVHELDPNELLKRLSLDPLDDPHAAEALGVPPTKRGPRP